MSDKQRPDGLFEAIFENAGLGIALFDLDMRPIVCNPAMEAILGYTSEELGTKRFSEIFHPDDVEADNVNFAELMEGKRKSYSIEKHYLAKDGRTIWGNLFVTIMRDENGKPKYIIGMIKDISQRKSAEVALRASEDQYRHALEKMMEGCQLIDADYRYLFTNEMAAKHGRKTREELVGRKMTEVYPGIDQTEMFAMLRKCMEERMPCHLENEFTHPDGDKEWFELSMQPMPEGIFVLSIDITERKRAEENLQMLNEELEQRVLDRTAQLEDVNKELDAFSYSVSHDLRAPLRAIDGFSEALLEECRNNLSEDGQRYLERIRRACKRMSQLIDDLLRLSRLSRKRVECRPMNLSLTVEKVIENLQRLNPERKVNARVEPYILVEGDPQLLRVALENLLGNAWKYTSKRAEAQIELGKTEVGGEIAYFVKDNGAGFDMAYAEKLFRPFERLHKEADFPGTGIGLALVQRIIHRHGGKVWAEGKVGEGATFFFTLGKEIS